MLTAQVRLAVTLSLVTDLCCWVCLISAEFLVSCHNLQCKSFSFTPQLILYL